MNKDNLLEKLKNAVVACDQELATNVALEVLDAGIGPLEAITEGAVKGLGIIGEKYNRLEVYLPELIKAGDSMKAVLDVFLPHIKGEDASEIIKGKVILGTVSGDNHDIGKNMVDTMLTMERFEVFDLGIDVPGKQFVQKAEEVNADVIAMSALLTTTAYYQEEVIKYLRDAGLRDKYYVVVGGSPISAEWASQIGADGYGKTAVDAGKVINKLLSVGTPPPLSRPIVFE